MRRVLLSLAFLVPVVHAASPSKIEPPDWFASPNRQQLLMLVSGAGLADLKVQCDGPGFLTGAVQISPTGTHALFDLTIPPNTKPGTYHCAGLPFAIVPALPPQGRFQGFSTDDIIYLVMPDRFSNGDPANDDPAISRGLFNRANRRFYHGGDFAGIRQRLPYLKQLGITALWLTPVYDNLNRLDPTDQFRGEKMTGYHGYHATDYYAVEEHFGTLAEYRALVDAAHAAGIKVIQDQVANHIGNQHPWVDDLPRPSWLHGSRANHPTLNFQTWALPDPNAAPELRKSVLDGWFAGRLADLNQDDPQMARYLIQNAVWWIARSGADAIRQDTFQYAPRPFWRDWNAALHAQFPRLTTLGEVLEADPCQTSFFQGGRKGFDGIDTGLDSVFDFPLYFTARDVFIRHKAPLALAKLFAHDALYPNPRNLVTLLGLHDTARFMGEPGVTSADLLNAFTFLFTARGVPMIYYGDEIGMPGGDDPENRRDFPGGFPGDPRNAFEAGGRTAEENRLFDRVKQLAALRASSKALRQGVQSTLFASDTTFAFTRTLEHEQWLIVVHTGANPETIALPRGGELKCEIGCSGNATASRLPLAPNSTAVYRVQ